MGLGNVYQSLGEYAQAEQYYLQSLEIKRQIGDKAGEGNSLNNLGIVYENLGEYAQAEQYYRQSLGRVGFSGTKRGRQNPQKPGRSLPESGRIRPSRAKLPSID